MFRWSPLWRHGRGNSPGQLVSSSSAPSGVEFSVGFAGAFTTRCAARLFGSGADGALATGGQAESAEKSSGGEFAEEGRDLLLRVRRRWKREQLASSSDGLASKLVELRRALSGWRREGRLERRSQRALE
ncbi:unnamed protein product, partial [Ostreobium quekettii]